jgi:hypothetical protein
MSVKTAIAGITFSSGGKNAAAAAGADLAGMIAQIQMQCDEIKAKLNYLVTDVLTPSGTEASNITTINTQISALV